MNLKEINLVKDGMKMDYKINDLPSVINCCTVSFENSVKFLSIQFLLLMLKKRLIHGCYHIKHLL